MLPEICILLFCNTNILTNPPTATNEHNLLKILMIADKEGRLKGVREMLTKRERVV